MKLTNGNRVIDITNDVHMRAYLNAGWEIAKQAAAQEVAAEPVSGGSDAMDYNSLTDDELAVYAADMGIETEGKTRRQVINAIKKEG